jgi:hypothetical protein
MERVYNSVPVPGAPDGVSVVGPIVVGANVGVDVVGANVSVDVVGASVGVTAAHTFASASLRRRRLLASAARYPEYPHRPCGTPTWVTLSTPWFRREPLEDPQVPLGPRRVPVEYP